ncbi:multiple sugar transport system substrate-binding protein [Arthrobacter sp. CAN_A212]|uniref:ABC transporter substrate-binding protein n=1 Tax=unclassified Arthrobacter TaxID=235627 RepID=UPI0018C9702C|nr:ABC transporter substrate-binding protein [Arthrobacter sp. CAN_C5]MBP2217885.1 multiple sugar transport system substrate-binding protein [Arthrobacter sp. CAN_C5]
MTRYTKRALAITATAMMGLGLAACGGGGGDAAGDGELTSGPITIWYSNNQDEVAWGEAMVEAWNADNPDQEVTAQEIPAGTSSEEVIAAAITAGNAPCIVMNTAPVAVPQFQEMGGLVPLDTFEDGVEYVESRSGDVAEQYKSADGQYYQLPWKSNPVVLYYNKDLFEAAGLDPENPPLGTQDELLETSRTLVESGEVEYAMWPSPAGEFYQSWFDFYPFFAAATGGTQLVVDGGAAFNTEEGKAVAGMWQTMYEEGLSSQEAYTGDSFVDGKAAIAISGPWAIPYYGDDVNWGTAPVPGLAEGDESYTFSDAKNMAIYSACDNQQTAWDLMKFATSEEQDGELLEITGQMPIRTDLAEAYSEYFEANPAYTEFADQASRAVEVPNVPNSVEIWQTFRDAYGASVIFGNETVDDAFTGAAEEITNLASEE